MFSEIVLNNINYIAMDIGNGEKKILFDNKFNKINKLYTTRDKVFNLHIGLITLDEFDLFEKIFTVPYFHYHNHIQPMYSKGRYNVYKLPKELHTLIPLLIPNTILRFEKKE